MPRKRTESQQVSMTRLTKVIRSDNGTEFCGKTMATWAHERGVLLRLIEPGKPNQNACIESFNGRFRDECLNEHWFPSLLRARVARGHPLPEVAMAVYRRVDGVATSSELLCHPTPSRTLPLPCNVCIARISRSFRAPAFNRSTRRMRRISCMKEGGYVKKNASSSIEQSFVVVLPDGTAAIYDRPLIATIQHGPTHENISLTTAHLGAKKISHIGEIGMATPKAVLLPTSSSMDALDKDSRVQLRAMYDAGVAIATPSAHAEYLLDTLGESGARGSAPTSQHALFATRGGSSAQQAFLALDDSAAESFPFSSHVESFIDFLYAETRNNVPYPQVLVADDASAPQGPWTSRAADLKWQYAGKGGTGQLWVNGYQLNPLEKHPAHKDFNYFLIVMQVAQGNISYVQKCDEVGYYCQKENVVVTAAAGQDIYEYGPNSTIGTSTVSFSIGASLQGAVSEKDGASGGAGVSAEWGVSYSAPDTTFTVTPYYPNDPKACAKVEYVVDLPGVGFQSPGIPANPKFASKGYSWTAALVIRAKKGENAKGVIDIKINWDKDKPRGIASSKDQWVGTYAFSFPPGS
ncbi:hypothetical protein GCM10007901_20330 [Dyella acidisoli]|uniref:Integrase catalytic domain-containing protein n=1 Tax=Dyella acidisoli TaxID=1867834 RepID=A0ABQ5XN15_9GAMM|nr:hypothetical protein GCM10007901_20330 [Dyella acidisoli]